MAPTFMHYNGTDTIPLGEFKVGVPLDSVDDLVRYLKTESGKELARYNTLYRKGETDAFVFVSKRINYSTVNSDFKECHKSILATYLSAKGQKAGTGDKGNSGSDNELVYESASEGDLESGKGSVYESASEGGLESED